MDSGSNLLKSCRLRSNQMLEWQRANSMKKYEGYCQEIREVTEKIRTYYREAGSSSTVEREAEP